MRTANPALSDWAFGRAMQGAAHRTDADAMTLRGTAYKTGLLLLLTIAAAAYAWWEIGRAMEGDFVATFTPFVIGGLGVGLVVALITFFLPRAAIVTGPVYAISQGVALGAVSAIADAAVPGVVVVAVGCTFGVLGALLLVYFTNLIQPTENLKLAIASATGGLVLFYLGEWALRLLGVNVPLFHEMLYASNWMGILFGVLATLIAAANLVLDFDFIERCVQRGAPKHVEWFAAFGLMVTLLWLYIEILHLLMKVAAAGGGGDEE